MKGFRFLDLPSELRLKIYRMHLRLDDPVDLHQRNYRRIAPRLRLFQTCHVVHEEAYRVFYGDQIFRLFSTDGKFFNTRRHLVARLSSRYRAALTHLELRVGPGFSAPPKSWFIGPHLGLRDMTSLRRLSVFIELDPDSARNMVFIGFRRGGLFYTHFCGDLVRGVLAEAPWIREVHFDKWPSVTRDGPMVMRLVKEALETHKRITWSPSWAELPACG